MESTLHQSFQHVKKEIIQLREQQRLLTRDLEKKMTALQEHQEHKFQQQLEAHKKASSDTSQEVKDTIEALKVEYILTLDEQQNTSAKTYATQAEINALKQTIKKLAAEKERLAIELGEFQQECLQGLMELNTYTNNEIKNIRKEVKTLIHACTSVFTLREQLYELLVLKEELQPLLQHNIPEQYSAVHHQISALQQQVQALQDREVNTLPATDLQKHIVVLSTKVNNLKEELEVKTNGFSHDEKEKMHSLHN